MRTIYVGMDIHKSFIQAAAMDGKGRVVAEERLGVKPRDIGKFMESLGAKDIKAAIEATCTWYHVYDTLESLGVDTTLVNVRRTKVIAESKIKTDKLDAVSIAHCLRTGFIAKSWIPSRNARDLRSVIRHRISLRRDMTRYKNRVHAILLRNGVEHGYSDLFGVAGMRFLESLEMQGPELYRLQSNLKVVKALMRERYRAERKITSLCRDDRQAMLLTSIKGISYYSAMIIMSEVDDIRRFPNPKKLCSYAGLVPRTMQSGSHVYHGRILKECNQNLKWILNQCVHSHIRFAKNSPVTRLYYRVERKKGTGKAVVAAARKMLCCMWYMLVRGEEFKYAD